MNSLATLTIATAVLSLLCLVGLHFLSPGFKPGFRMVSEYALGKSKWLLVIFFFAWGASSISLSVLLWKIVSTQTAGIGVILLFVSGIGAIMGGLFDVKHKLQGMSFLLGVPTLPIAALLIANNLIRLEPWRNHFSVIVFSTVAVWISLILMVVAMIAMFSSFKKAGIPVGKSAAPIEKLPEGVKAVNGYANRVLVLCYVLWLLIIANIYISV
ncbi:hypothetical protein BH11BAC4_BH11BAC4_09220 [soil metagenome]